MINMAASSRINTNIFFEDSKFIGNIATGSSELDVTAVKFFGGGALRLDGVKIVAKITRCSFIDNIAKTGGQGGAISLSNGAAVQSFNLIAQQNVASTGGFLYAKKAMPILLQGALIENSRAFTGGGAIALFSTTMALDSVRLARSTCLGSVGGGALLLDEGSTAHLLNTEIIDSESPNGPGGHVVNIASSLNIYNRDALVLWPGIEPALASPILLGQNRFVAALYKAEDYDWAGSNSGQGDGTHDMCAAKGHIKLRNKLKCLNGAFMLGYISEEQWEAGRTHSSTESLTGCAIKEAYRFTDIDVDVSLVFNVNAYDENVAQKEKTQGPFEIFHQLCERTEIGGESAKTGSSLSFGKSRYGGGIFCMAAKSASSAVCLETFRYMDNSMKKPSYTCSKNGIFIGNGVVVSNNTASQTVGRNAGGGGALSAELCDVTLDSSIIIQNTAKSTSGGAVYLGSGGSLYSHGNTSINLNKARNGGAIMCDNCEKLVIGGNTHIMKNGADENGGGLFLIPVLGNTVQIQTSHISSNTAGRNGGAVYGRRSHYTEPLGKLNISGSLLDSNVALNGSGGALSIEGLKLNFANQSKCTNNVAKKGGGGALYWDPLYDSTDLSLWSHAEPHIDNSCILKDNIALYGHEKATSGFRLKLKKESEVHRIMSNPTGMSALYTSSAKWTASQSYMCNKQTYHSCIRLGILDYYSQWIQGSYFDGGIEATAEIKDHEKINDAATLIGAKTAIFSSDTQGEATFSELGMKGWPLSGPHQLTFSTSVPFTGTLSRQIIIETPEPAWISKCPSDLSISPSGQRCIVCPGGYEDVEGKCISCPPGRFKLNAGSFSCTACPEDTWNQNHGSVSVNDCISCKYGKSTGGTTGNQKLNSCKCRPSRYVGGGLWDNTHAHYANATNVQGNLSVCAKCPIGAVCPVLDTTPQNMYPQTGWWRAGLSVDFTNCELPFVAMNMRAVKSLAHRRCCPMAGNTSTCANSTLNKSAKQLCGGKLGAHEAYTGVLCQECPIDRDRGLFYVRQKHQCILCKGKEPTLGMVLLSSLPAFFFCFMIMCYLFIGAARKLQKKQSQQGTEKADAGKVSKKANKRRVTLFRQAGKNKDTISSTTRFASDQVMISQVSSASGHKLTSGGNENSASVFDSLKILVGWAQVFSTTISVYKLPWPESVKDMASAFAMVNLDFGSLFDATSCRLSIPFLQKFLIHMFIPVIFFALIGLAFLFSKLYKVSQSLAVVVAREKKKLLWKLLITVILLMYPGLCARMFAVFACVEVKTVGLVLQADYSVRCYSPLHNIYITISAASVLLWFVGIPMGVFLILYSKRRVIKDPSNKMYLEVKSEFGSLFAQYKPQYYGWETIIISKKAMLTGLMSVVLRGSPLQLVLAIFIVLAYLLVVLKIVPYRSEFDDWLSFLTTCQMFLTFFGGLLILTDDEAEPSYDETTLGVALCLINSLSLIVFVVSLALLHPKIRSKVIGFTHRKSAAKVLPAAPASEARAVREWKE